MRQPASRVKTLCTCDRIHAVPRHLPESSPHASQPRQRAVYGHRQAMELILAHQLRSWLWLHTTCKGKARIVYIALPISVISV